MTLTILKRNLERGDADKYQVLQQIAKLDRQLEEAVLGIRALQQWEPNASAMETPSEILMQGNKLMGTQLGMRNIAIDYVPNDIHDMAEVRKQPFLYAWLGLLCYFEDHLDQPVTLHMEQKSTRSICVEITQPLYDVNSLKPLSDRGSRLIDKSCLLALCEASGIELEFNQRHIAFNW